MKKQLLKPISTILLLTFALQLVLPLTSHALTTGPSQPEVQAFEPVGTTEMVDLFSGDFVYNIPLMDVDGYPINISYHGGIGMEQEASWVGLGWSLNPGEINRSVRGIPDDFNGDNIVKHLDVQPEQNYMGKVGAEFKPELFGYDPKEAGFKIGADLSMYMNFNNYKGVSAGVRAGVTFSYSPGTGNPGSSIGFTPSLGVGSQSGTDLDASLNYSLSKKDKPDDKILSYKSIGIGSGVNSRSGMTSVNINVGSGSSEKGSKSVKGKDHSFTQENSRFSGSSTIPIGIQNYVPVVTNASVLSSYNVQLKAGGELIGTFLNYYTGVTYSKMILEQDGTKSAYGYMYLENASKNKTGILDFIRDKDGIYNKTIQNLPLSSLAYDIFSVSGQGTGGSFRPFRNDIGTIYDPRIATSKDNKSVGIELGFGDLFEAGGDVGYNSNTTETGPWLTADFQGGKSGTLYEKMFYKQAGELTCNRQIAGNALYSSATPLDIRGTYVGNPFTDARTSGAISFSKGNLSGLINNGLGYFDMDNGRTARANLITPLTADHASSKNYSSEPEILSYNHSETGYYNHLPGSIDVTHLSRVPAAASSNSPLKSRISYVSQTLPDGRRYIYGIPAINNTTEDVSLGKNAGVKNDIGGLINLGQGSTPSYTYQDPERYFSRSITPSYAHAYLLTEVLSSDYVDITGDGCSDDDLGGFVKLNYSRTSEDYRWRSPAYDLANPGDVTAHFDPGFQSDPRDGKAMVSMGSREQWYMHSIESKNLIAEFYTSSREDAKGMSDAGMTSAPTTNPNNLSYKLDSIRLFNKSERIQNGISAIPIKTVMFDYDYSLCPNTPNSTASPNVTGTLTGKGKLTLKRVFIRYGNSDKNLLSPYQFAYNNPLDDAGHPFKYNYDAKDRWGSTNEKEQKFSALDPFEFPYTSQKNYPVVNTDPATSFSLSQITLPSGGVINVAYESDDYAFVQDKRAMQMFKLEGLGKDINFHAGSALYRGDNQYNFLYFKRDPTKEVNQTDLRKTYLKDETHLYYSVDVEIRNGAYEQIKGFGEIVDIGACPPISGSSDQYGYIELKKVNSNNCDFSPVTLYAMNFAKWNLNHIIYPGYNTNSLKDILSAFVDAAREIRHIRRPLQTFLEEGYCGSVNLAKSFIRLQSPNLIKKGGGIRVKRLTISDNWGDMNSGSTQLNATFGKDYDYTIDDPEYGHISSGVASYEPITGGDENPLRKPIPYIAAENIAMPAIDFYQLEPLGENFYPGGSVGYSSVKVRSIHIDQGKSSMSEEENLFYTAKDYPVRVEYTNKNENSFEDYSLFDQNKLEQASQGYSLYLNDMHGKPKGKNSYVVTKYDNTTNLIEKHKKNGITYVYNESAPKQLSSLVKAFRLQKNIGQNSGYQYAVEDMELGKESDLVFDSRENFDESSSIGAAANLNVLWAGLVVLGTISVFPSAKHETTVFHSMVGTKIIQQYGILKKIETYEDETKTSTTENLIYDAESGNVLLSKTNNEFNDDEYAQNIPAYLAYEGMAPSYTNTGYVDNPIKLYVNKIGDGYMDVADKSIYSEGDELVYHKADIEDKLWITRKGTTDLSSYYGYNSGSQTCLAFFSGDGGQYHVYLTGHSASTDNQQNTNDPWNLNLNTSNTITLSPGTYSLNVERVVSGIAVDLSVVTFTIIPGVPLAIYNISHCRNTPGYNGPGGVVVIGSGGQTSTGTGNGNNGGGIGNSGSGTGGNYHGTGFSRVRLVDSLSTGPYCIIPLTDTKCFLQVNTRYKAIHANGSAVESNWWMQTLPKTLTNFTTEITRSGRRNMLGNTVQSSVVLSQPNLTTPHSLSDFIVSSGLISIGAQTYTNEATPYENFDGALVPVSGSISTGVGGVYEGLNNYVVGLQGNFRPYEQFTAFADRSYITGNTHSRRDGTFTAQAGSFWKAGTSSGCEPWSIIYGAGHNFPNTWKKVSEATKYDIFGNAIEEKDALNIYTSAQYGYGSKLPVALASNARQQSFMFDGFEDTHTELIPDVIAQLFHSFTTSVNLAGNASATRSPSGFFQNPFSQFFDYINSTFNLTALQKYYCSGNQNQNIKVIPSNTQNGFAHSGNKMLSIANGWNLNVPVRSNYSDNVIESFALQNTSDYLLDVWVKSQAGTTAPQISVNTFNHTTPNVSIQLSPKGSMIEGWQLMEGRLVLSTLATAPDNANLTFAGSMTVDDIRILPIAGNMKSFVYDTEHNNRLSAELDANHYATFYEYDQEGQLIRVKKETEKGIVTISENRKSLKK